MSFENGGFTLTMLEYSGKLPENIVELFAAKSAGKLDGIGADPEVGWVTGRYLLDNNIDENSARLGNCYYFSLRRAERKIPSALLNALCRREEYAYMLENSLDFVPSKIRRSIKEDIIEKHLLKMPPAISGVSVAIEPREKLILLGATSRTALENFIEKFYSTVKIEPLPVNPGLWLAKFFNLTEVDLPILDLSGKKNDQDPAPGRDFLTFLWYAGEQGMTVKHEQYGEFELMIEGPLTLGFASEARGSQETVIKKGENPLRSAEAKAALSVGKKLRKAKFSLTRGKEIWSCVFDADNFSFGSLNLPEGEAMIKDDRFDERIQNVLIFRAALEEYFKLYVNLLKDEGVLIGKLREWVKGRDGI